MQKYVLVVLTACLALSSACRVGPKYKLPAVPQTPSGFKELTENDRWKFAKPNDGELRGNWWELFNDARLTELESMVSVSNESLKQAEAQFRQARALVRVNRAGYFPTVGTVPGIATSGAGRARAGSTSGVNSSFSIPITASWEPDLWGRVGLTVENAVTNAQAAAADVENARLSLQAELATDYFQLRALDMDVDLLTNTLDAYRKAVELTRNRYNGGVASKADVVLAQTQYDSTRAQLTDLGVARAQLEHAIAVLTGHAPSDLTIAKAAIQGPPPPIPVSLPSQLLERRPDVAANERRVAAANATIGLAQAAFYPSLSISASAGLESGSLGTLFNWPARFWSVGPQLAQTLFDAGRRKATVEEFQAGYDS
ncbi:MAG: efflux transporter outer membrane subunit, partial [Bryobacteraceae bacterium]